MGDIWLYVSSISNVTIQPFIPLSYEQRVANWHGLVKYAAVLRCSICFSAKCYILCIHEKKMCKKIQNCRREQNYGDFLFDVNFWRSVDHWYYLNYKKYSSSNLVIV